MELGFTPDLQGASAPGVPQDVVDQERDLRAPLRVAPFLRLAEEQPAHIDRVLLGIEVERDRCDMGLAVGAHGGQPSQRLFPQVVDLLRCEDAHPTLLPIKNRTPVCRAPSDGRSPAPLQNHKHVIRVAPRSRLDP